MVKCDESFKINMDWKEQNLGGAVWLEFEENEQCFSRGD